MRRDRMIIAGMVFAGALAATGPAVAQEAGNGRRAWGTVQIGPSYFLGWEETALLQIGAGYEVVWPNGFGLSIDGNVLVAAEEFEPGALLVSPALLYEFPRRGKLRPYIRGGITLVNFYLPMADFGGGVNYWLTERLGFKAEVRQHLLLLDDPASGITSIRGGLNFRF